MTASMRIARAEPSLENFEAVLNLIDDAAAWLRDKGTSQWAAPWPDEERRNARVRRGLQGGKTWIVWDGDRPAATVTIATRANTAVWSKPACECDLSERAVYVHRLITARSHAGLGLGAELIDWAGLRGRREYGAKWIRIDVWTDNTGLHDYYLGRGFERCGRCADASYPSGALFQKRVPNAAALRIPQFTGGSAEFKMRGALIPA
jgi:GNAT superfamily N-acetyltransferase